jgi:iron only hydrogenase large subunit-like protein
MSCPYGAIHKSVVPCEDACPVNAITKDENGKEQIDIEKCISCGKCLQSCPFGAIVERSQLVDVLNLIHNSDKKVVAMLAPAVVGQFPFEIEQVVGALKKAGFADVVEVAAGADVTSRNEANEFVERMKEGAQFMTTSCCPAYYRAAKVHVPEIQPFVSNTKTPMYYTAEMLKKEQPDCVAVFVGPCLAKRTEAEYDPNVDYVLTFEEMGAMFVGAGIEIGDCEKAEFAKVSSAQGRQYPLSGGVAGAVGNLVEGQVEFRPERIDGLSKENIKLLKRYATKGSENNMIEVMCCEGGCIAGPGCIALAKKAAKQVESYVAKGTNQKEMENK